MDYVHNEYSLLVHVNPRAHYCVCKTAPLIPNFPLIHCPACHRTWTARTNHYPARCNNAACHFNLRRWRSLNGIPDTPIFLNSAPASARPLPLDLASPSPASAPA
jgi:hypothetical protein